MIFLGTSISTTTYNYLVKTAAMAEKEMNVNIPNSIVLFPLFALG